MDLEVQIRKVQLKDIDVLQKISIKTFEETFSEVNSDEDMSNYIMESMSLEKLSNELNQYHNSFYFLYYKNTLCAYMKLNWESNISSDKNLKNYVELERIYVLKDYHHKGYGKKLLDYAINKAKDKNKNYLVLGVWEYNSKAINFYLKNSFIEFDSHIFKLGKDLQTDLLMKLKLH